MSEETKPEEKTAEDVSIQGAFFESLTRNNRKIRKDRAEAIAEDAQVLYERTIQDLRLKIKRMKREQENMLDLSPDHAQSLKLASDFNAEEYVAADLRLGVDIRNTGIKLEIAENRYQYLFGGN